jgi:hypothetical protein
VRQKLAFVLAAAVVALLAILVMRGGSDSSTVSPAAKEPRLVLSRPWFERMPKSRNDTIQIWWFGGGGIGLYEKGARYQVFLELFELERNKDSMNIVFLHDKKKEDVKFEIVSCSDQPPFDLCLDLKDPLRGKKRFYSWDDDADMDANIPWAREWKVSAEARARSVNR